MKRVGTLLIAFMLVFASLVSFGAVAQPFGPGPVPSGPGSNQSQANVTATGGTAALTEANRAGLILNLRDFNAAACTGGDDTTAINAALTQLASQGGGQLNIPGAACHIASQIVTPAATGGGTFYTKIVIMCQRYSSNFVPTASMTSLFKVTQGYFDIEGCAFANASGYATSAILVDKSGNTSSYNLSNRYEKNSFSQFTSAILINAGYHQQIVENFFNSNTGNIIYGGESQEDIIQSNNMLGGNGIDVNPPYPGNDVEGLKIVTNTIQGSAASTFGIRIRFGVLFQIVGNTISAITSTQDYHAVELDSSSASVRRVQMTDNWEDSGADSSVTKLVYFHGPNLYGVYVANNSFETAAGYNLYIDGSPGYGTGISVVNSFFSYPQGSAGTGDIYVNQTDLALFGNTFQHPTNSFTEGSGFSVTIATGNYFTAVPRHSGSLDRFIFNFGDTGTEFDTAGLSDTSGSPVVNHLQAQGSATGNSTAINAIGTDANIPIALIPKGNAQLLIYTDAIGLASQTGNTMTFYLLGHPVVTMTNASASDVNSVDIFGATTGNGPGLSAQGTDTNVALKLMGQGTGGVVFYSGASNLGGMSSTGVFNAVAGYQANGTAGVSCSGTPSGSFATVNGIVTHC